MIKKIFISIFLFSVILAGLAVLTLTNSTVSRKIIPLIIHEQYSNVKIEKLAIGRQSFVFPGRLALEDVRGKLAIGNVKYEFNLRSFELLGKNLFLLGDRRILLQIRAGRFSSEELDVTGADIDGELTNSPLARGRFLITAAQWLGYAAGDINGEFIIDRQQIVIRPLKAEIYGGHIDAEIVLEYPKNVEYSINTKFADVKIKQLEMINAAFFSNMKGAIDGDLKIRGDISGINSMGGSVWSSQGGEIRAVLLKPLLDYIPQSTQKKELDLLIKEQKNIPLDTAVLKITNLEDDKVATKIDLESQKFNLDIGLALDFNIEGGMKNLLKLQEQLFLQGR